MAGAFDNSFGNSFDNEDSEYQVRVRPTGSTDSTVRGGFKYLYDVTELTVTTTVTCYAFPVNRDPVSVTILELSAVDAGLLAGRLHTRREAIHRYTFEKAVI